jgi:predicted nucleic acid-binding protein
VRVVADTGPLHYLVLIHQIELLPLLFAGVAILQIVRDELDRPTTPTAVRTWIGSPPPWLSVVPGPLADVDTIPAALDDGERAAIALAVSLSAELLLMDDRAGVAVARARGLAVTGTLGLLDRAARRGLVDLAVAFDALKTTNFHTRQALLDMILAAWKNDSRL